MQNVAEPEHRIIRSDPENHLQRQRRIIRELSGEAVLCHFICQLPRLALPFGELSAAVTALPSMAKVGRANTNLLAPVVRAE